MALPLPVQPSPIATTPPRPLTAFMERQYRPSPGDALVFQKYLFGEYNLLVGSGLVRVNPGSGPAANYFTPLKRFLAWEVQFEWNDLNAFYWWWPLPEVGGGEFELEFDADDYFPDANRIPAPEYEAE